MCTKADRTELQTVLDLFKRTNRLHMKAFDKLVGSMKIRRSQHRILMYLSHHGPAVSQKDMADEFEISPAAVAVTLKKLEEEGYIEKTVHENDNRYNYVNITEKGRSVVDMTHERFFEVDMLMFKDLTESELETLGTCLKKMHGSLKHIYDGAGRKDDKI